MATQRCLNIPKLILFGDSITQRSFSHDGCWGSLLANSLISNVKEIAGITIFLGANDATDPEKNERQNVPLKEYQSNIESMINYLEGVGVGKDRVILITPPVCDPPAWAPHAKERGTDNTIVAERAAQFADICRQVAKDAGVLCVDLHSAMSELPNYKDLLVDGLHFSNQGSKLLHSLLWPHIDQLTSSLPSLLPMWDEIDIYDPESSYKKLQS